MRESGIELRLGAGIWALLLASACLDAAPVEREESVARKDSRCAPPLDDEGELLALAQRRIGTPNVQTLARIREAFATAGEERWESSALVTQTQRYFDAEWVTAFLRQRDGLARAIVEVYGSREVLYTLQLEERHWQALGARVDASLLRRIRALGLWLQEAYGLARAPEESLRFAHFNFFEGTVNEMEHSDPGHVFATVSLKGAGTAALGAEGIQAAQEGEALFFCGEQGGEGARQPTPHWSPAGLRRDRVLLLFVFHIVGRGLSLY